MFECLGAKDEKRTSGWGVGGASSWTTAVSAAEAATVKRVVVVVVGGGRWEREREKESEGLSLMEGKVKALELKVGRRFR